MHKLITRKSFLIICLATAISACLRRRGYSIANQDAEGFYPPLGQVDVINGLNFHSYQTRVSKENVILIHFADINLRKNWQFANSGAKQKIYKSIYVDRRGFGYCERNNSSWTAR